ncbi:MAG: EAL domain-containing protein [Chloroflexi bacterium]|nr:EAL domain-containing protein [Chloroflexota bacterium]
MNGPPRATTQGRRALLDELRRGLDQGDLTLYFQPKAHLASGRITGAEALIRWRHPERGLLSPDQFVPQAEQTPLIRSLSSWVLDAALRQCALWHGAGLPINVAANLSARDLRDPALPKQVGRALASRMVPPECLELEITEGTLIDDLVRAADILARLCARGVRIAIDDIGSGYGSLAYLKELPVDIVKIDRPFIRDMVADDHTAAIVRAIIDLAHTLGLSVTAEGVENQATMRLLADLGCDEAQGHYIGQPMPAADFDRWLAARHGSPDPTFVL